ncbi:hypothetical protein ACEPAI_7234 [Sanghuangporus weigelae]
MAASLPDAQLVVALQSLQNSIFVDVATFTILIYDYIITFDNERNLMWPMSFKSPAKLLYFVTRYVPFIDTSLLIAQHFQPGLTASDCVVGIKVMGWCISFGLMFSEVILTYRTWAIYERSQKMGIGLCIWFLAFWVPQFVITGIFLNSVVYTTLPPPLRGCLGIAGNPIDFINWVLLMVYEAGILALMMIKAIQSYRVHGRSPMYKTVFQDGSLFYVYLFVVSILNIVFIVTSPGGNSQILVNFERVIHSVLTARLLVSIRRLAPELNLQGNLTIGTNVTIDLDTFEAKSPVSSLASSSTRAKACIFCISLIVGWDWYSN